VLQALGLVVQLVDLVVEHAMQEGLDEAVVTDDLEGAAAARGREPDTAVALILDQRILRRGQFLQHVGDGGRGHFQAFGQGGRADAAALAATQGKDGLEIVVD
jgi:hypothetical protein